MTRSRSPLWDHVALFVVAVAIFLMLAAAAGWRGIPPHPVAHPAHPTAGWTWDDGRARV